MGIQTDEIEYGNDCGCFPAGETPKYVFASFLGIEACPPVVGWQNPAPPNSIYALQQSAVSPCVWAGTHGAYSIQWSIDPVGIAHLGIGLIPPHAAMVLFEGNGTGGCDRYFTSTIVPGDCDFFIRCHGGTGMIWFTNNPPVPGIKTVMDLINMEVDEHTKTDFYPISADKTLLKLARRKDATNILIEYEE